MPHDRTHLRITISRREVAAAWACCGLVVLGALLVDAVDKRDDARIAAFEAVIQSPLSPTRVCPTYST
jgi:hypothetical protein